MKRKFEKEAFLLTDDGSVFRGGAFGYIPADAKYGIGAVGEIVYTGGSCMKAVTDPAYKGQLVVSSFPIEGSSGVIPADFESAGACLGAYIVREYSQEGPSNFRSEGALDVFLCENKIPGLYGIDTRALIRKVRDSGRMIGIITYEEPDIEKYRDLLSGYTYVPAEASDEPSDAAVYTVEPEGEKKADVVVWDLGTRKSIITTLAAKGARVTVLPYSASCADIMACGADGVVVSGGPGDPLMYKKALGTVKELIANNVKLLGMSLGHQLIALAVGAETERMKHGHRGQNQPIRRTKDNLVFTTTQNHGYAVKSHTLPAGAKVTFASQSDGTCEGIEYSSIPAMSVQFIPECGGPRETAYIYDRFLETLK